MKPGDIVVYRERYGNYTDDKIRRATVYRQEHDGRLCATNFDAPSQLFIVHRSDILRVEPSQHGWPWR